MTKESPYPSFVPNALTRFTRPCNANVEPYLTLWIFHEDADCTSGELYIQSNKDTRCHRGKRVGNLLEYALLQTIKE